MSSLQPTYFGSSEVNQGCPLPPYNTMNFTAANPPIYSTLVSYAKNSPSYPLPAGTDRRLITAHQQNIGYFQSLNLQTSSIKALNGAQGTLPYPQFRSERERLMYVQGRHATASRNVMTGENPSAPMGVPCSTIYQYIAGP